MEQKKPLTLDDYEAAAAGDRGAIDTVVAYYADEIDALCTKRTRKRNGTIVSHIDEDMRHEIIMRLIADLPSIAEKVRLSSNSQADNVDNPF